MTAECVNHGPISEGFKVLDTPKGTVPIQVESASVSNKYLEDPEYPCLIDIQLQNYQRHFVEGVPLPKGVIIEPEVTNNNECPRCGMCIKWKILDEIVRTHKASINPTAINCVRFGKIEPGTHVMKGTSRNGCSDIELHVSHEIAQTDNRPTAQNGDCLIARKANELLKDMRDGKHKFNNSPWMGCSGYCPACAETMTFSVGVKRLT